MKRHVILEDQERPLIWFDHAHKDEITPIQFVGYILSAIALVGIVWLVASLYILVGTPQ